MSISANYYYVGNMYVHIPLCFFKDFALILKVKVDISGRPLQNTLFFKRFDLFYVAFFKSQNVKESTLFLKVGSYLF
jgi:hypothetical protein